MPLDAIGAGLAELEVVTTLCPRGKERLRRLLNVLASGRIDLKVLFTRRFRLKRQQVERDARPAVRRERAGPAPLLPTS